MSYRCLANVLSRQDNSKTILRCLEDVLCRLGKLSAEKSQKKPKTRNFNAFLMFSKQRWMDAPDCE